MNDIELKKLQMIYDKVAEHHRYYLSWRQYLLGGYFAVIATLFYACFQLFTNTNCIVKSYSIYTAISISVISFIFWWLDERNRKLYQNCQKVGAAIESKLDIELEYNGEKLSGLYFDLDKSYQYNHKKKWIRILLSEVMTHTWAIRILYILGFIIGIFVAIQINLLLN
jgi:hypothetical protein